MIEFLWLVVLILAGVTCYVYMCLAEMQIDIRNLHVDKFMLEVELKNLRGMLKEVTQAQKDITNLNRAVEFNTRRLNSLVIEVNKLQTSKVITIDNVELPKDFEKVETGEIKVNNLHDGHYKALGIEPWDILKANMTYEEYKGFLKGNIQKYLHRNKEGLKDYEKLANYANKLVKEVSEHDNNTNNNG